VITRAWGALSCAGLLALAGCAAFGRDRATASPDPGARQVAATQQQSEKALEQAKKAQEKATEQANKAAQADQEVQEAQRRLAEAREHARVEHERARQLQEEANRATEQASAQARESQEQAARSLAQQTDRAQRGEQVISGQVLRATSDAITVRPQGKDDPMTFRIDGRTRVRVAGQQASATDIQQGEDARVAYEVSGTEPVATEVHVLRSVRGSSSTGSPSRPPSTGSSGSSTGSSSSTESPSGSSSSGSTSSDAPSSGTPADVPAAPEPQPQR
jgi:hypothetical protein